MDYEIRPLSQVLGAEIFGIDLRQDLASDDIQELYDLIHQYQFLVFRDQQFTLEEQIRACGQFGEIELHPAKEVPWKYREITYVANTDPTYTQVLEHCGPNFELWHSDTCYLSKPARISMLYAERVPGHAGETLFANMIKAYEDLPEKMKIHLADKRAVFGSGEQLMKRCQGLGYHLQIPPQEIEPDVIHPVIRTHPYTQKKSIFVNWAHTDRILDVNEGESQELLEYLYQHAQAERYRYEHYPKAGDLMVWDNASTIHSNTAKKLTEIRVMRRVMIKGDTPY